MLLHLNEYLILENNPGIGWYSDVISGKTIKIPNAYAKLFLLMIDKEQMLPISEKIYDAVHGDYQSSAYKPDAVFPEGLDYRPCPFDAHGAAAAALCMTPVAIKRCMTEAMLATIAPIAPRSTSMSLNASCGFMICCTSLLFMMPVRLSASSQLVLL